MTAHTTLIERARDASGSGIWPHSQGDEYFTFCVGQSHHKAQAFMAWAAHHQISVKPLFGQYKGKRERSFVAHKDSLERIRPWLIEEESILILRKGSRAILRFLRTGEEEDLGTFRMILPEDVPQHESWSYCPLQKAYLVAA